MESMAGDRNISVFIPTANCQPWLERAINSMVCQTYPFVNVYVVDDASGDVNEKIMNNFPQVTFLRMNESSGPYVIDNLLLRLTESAFIAFQDADDQSSPERFELQMRYLLANQLDGCGSWSVHVDTFGDSIGFETFPENTLEALYNRNYYPLRHPTCLLHRYVLDTIGGFDNEARFGGDSEYLFRAYLSFRMGNVPRFLYRHMIRPDSLTQHPDTGFHSERRKAFDHQLISNIEAVLTGQSAKPAHGYLLNGKKAGLTRNPGYEVLQMGLNNQSWKGI